MQTLHMLFGPPASGKSTLARILVERDSVLVCPDEFRVQYPEWSANDQSLFYHIHRCVREELSAGHDVVYDALNTYPQWRRPIIAAGYYAHSMVIGVHLDTPLAICLERHRNREKNISQQTLTDEVITRYWEALQQYPPTLNEGFHRLLRITPDDNPFEVLNLNRRPTIS